RSSASPSSRSTRTTSLPITSGNSMRLIFMGTPDFAVPALIELASRGHDIAAVYTRAPKPAGRRGLELTPSPVEREARELGLKVETPVTLKSNDAQALF